MSNAIITDIATEVASSLAAIKPSKLVRRTVWIKLILAVVPSIAFGVFTVVFTLQQNAFAAVAREQDQYQASEQRKQAIFDNCIDVISEILLSPNFNRSNVDHLQPIQVKVITALRRLDSPHKRDIIFYLYANKLIRGDFPLEFRLDLRGADLSEVEFMKSIIFIRINNGQCKQFGLYYILYYTYMLVFVCLIPLILMSIFGYLTYYNMRKLHMRIQPRDLDRNKRNIRKRDQELLRMVLGDVFVNLLTLFPYSFVILETAITTYISMNKSIDHIRIENFITVITSFLYLSNFAAPFYIFFTISKSFRKDFIEFIQHIRHALTTVNEGTIATQTRR
ncbi:unnamed protein product [Rotaria sp. Silwood2]|nr:unnamed protein product [Rotaria sp. Silwood2]